MKTFPTFVFATRDPYADVDNDARLIVSLSISGAIDGDGPTDVATYRLIEIHTVKKEVREV